MSQPFEVAAAYAGRYLITDAVSVDGVKYTGEMTFEPHGIFAHVTATLSTGETRFGLAVVFDDKLLIAWGPKDKVEIGAYRINGDQLTGIWVPPGAKGDDISACGQEQSSRVSDNQFEITKAFAIDMLPYTGSITIEELPSADPDAFQIVQMKWKLHDGDYASFGLKLGDFLVGTFSFEPEKPYAISAYVATPSGWEGTQLWKDSTTLAREQLKRA